MRTNRRNHIWCPLYALLLLDVFIISGCAGIDYTAKGFPAAGREARMDLLAMPNLGAAPGGYHDPVKLIGVKQEQHGAGAGALVGFLLGGINGLDTGAQIAYSFNAKAAEKHFKDVVSTSSIDLLDVSRRILAERLKSSPALHWKVVQAPDKPATAAPGGMAAIDVYPYILFKVRNDDEAHLWVCVRVQIPDEAGKVRWASTFFAEGPGLHTMSGPDGWLANGQALAAVEKSLARALDMFLAIPAGTYNADIRTQTFAGDFPTMDQVDSPMQLAVVSEGTDEFVGRSWLGDYYALNRGEFAVKK